MKISSIKNRADELLQTCKPQLIRIIAIVFLINLVPSLFVGYTWLYYLLSIVFLTVSHGYVVTSLKVVRNNAQSLNDDDAFVGWKRFKELFSTYFLSNVIQYVIGIAVVILMVVIFMIFFGNYLDALIENLSLGYLYSTVNSNDLSYFAVMLSNAPHLIVVLAIFLLIAVIVVVIVSTLLFATPYLLEQYHMTNMQAIKESVSFMKNHIWDMIKLELSFLGWMILMVIIQSVIAELLAFIPILGSMIAAIIGGLFGIYTYLPKYHLSLAIFFEEIAYYRYEQPYQTNEYQGDMNHV